MSMLDSFFNRGFRAAKCKTLLKLTMPRIKLLRNRREIQIKQMRKDIAKLLETGQEATARIRVEHIIREENMMAAQEILELYCEFITVRLPIIEAQRECPLELKEAISSVCFAAPRCADLPELLQVQILFVSKYGKEFVSAATELLPDCGVNRQVIELLSIRAPSPEKKLKLLKEIAEEHELDWDPAATETEFSKIHEDLLNGPMQFGSGSKLPLPKEKHVEALNTVANNVHNEQSDSDADLDTLDFPEVPKVSLRPNANTVPAPKIDPTEIPAFHPDINHELSNQSVTSKNIPEEPRFEPGEAQNEEPHSEPTEEKFVATKNEIPTANIDKEENQFLPFISPPSLSSPSFSPKPSGSPPPISRAKNDVNVDLQDVLAAAQTAAETAERAAAAARLAATLAQARISELTKKTGESFPESNENPFHADTTDQSAATEKPHFDHQQSFDHSVAFGKPTFDHQQSFGDYSGVPGYQDSSPTNENHQPAGLQDLPSFDKLKVGYDSPRHDHSLQPDSTRIQPQRLPSIDDDSYLAYPNLFSPQGVNHGSGSQSGKDGSPSSRGF